MKKVGVVGTGQTVGIAHYHAQGILTDGRVEIAAVYDINLQGAYKFVADHGLDQTRVCNSYQELLEIVDAVDICTPNFTHIDYVLEAIQADKAVLVEKPLAISTCESLRALQALEGKHLFNMVGFVYRYSYAIQELRKLVHNDIGRIFTFIGSFGGRRLANFTIPVEWRMVRKFSGSGALGDFGSHLVDLAYYIAGMSFETVSGMLSTVIPERPANADGITRVENDDQAAFVARTAENGLASFTVSRVGMDDMVLFVAGEGGLARLNLATPEVIHYLPSINGIYSTQPKEIKAPPQTPFEDWFTGEMKAFVDGLRGKEVEVADLRQGHYVECVLEAAEKANTIQSVKVKTC